MIKKLNVLFFAFFVFLSMSNWCLVAHDSNPCYDCNVCYCFEACVITHEVHIRVTCGALVPGSIAHQVCVQRADTDKRTCEIACYAEYDSLCNNTGYDWMGDYDVWNDWFWRWYNYMI